MKHLNVMISGDVQGVGFRFSVLEKAKALNLAGFVENRPDGRVYAEIEGREEVLEDFLAWCRKGPRGSRVDEVSAHPAPLRKLQGFEVRG